VSDSRNVWIVRVGDVELDFDEVKNAKRGCRSGGGGDSMMMRRLFDGLVVKNLVVEESLDS
jgi:hypothetical protein